MIDDLGGTEHVDELTADQHKRVVDECYQCKLCYVICPYTPDQQQEWRIDFPQLMLRSLSRTEPRRQGVHERTAPRPHRSPGQGRDHARADRERVHQREAGARPHGEGHGHRAGPAVARRSPACASRSGSRAARARRLAHARAGRAVPDLPRRVPGARRSARRWSACSSATASRAICPRVRSVAGCRGSTPATRRSSGTHAQRNVEVAPARRRSRDERSSCRSPRAPTR